MNSTSNSSSNNFWQSASKGALLVAKIAVGAAAIGLLIYGIGHFLPSTYGHWPLYDVIPLNEVVATFGNGLAWLAYFCIAGVLLCVLAMLGGWRDPNGK